MPNDNLHAAKNAKDDEFYTLYEDIQNEVNAYLEYNPDVFRGKTVLCPCDDPEWSNFTRFFAQNFEYFGLKRLISTSYAIESKNNHMLKWEPTEYESSAPEYDIDKSKVKGKIFMLDHDTNHSGNIDLDDLEWHYMQGDGDFRSAEVAVLMAEADIVVTNPPFSLFREFIEWIMRWKKKFLIIGNKNCITYRDVFPLIKENKIWVGRTPMGEDLLFDLPESIAEVLLREGKPGSKYKIINGKVYRRSQSCWFTNMDHGRRHQPISLMTMERNIRFSKHKEVKGIGYYHYDNCDGIEVPYTDAIPSDYTGIMGVPISFLDKYCPEQFKILGLSRDMDFPTKHGMRPEFVEDYFAQGNTGQIMAGHPDLGYYDKDGKVVVPYRRVMIRHLNPEETHE